jgi:hypothetical protein
MKTRAVIFGVLLAGVATGRTQWRQDRAVGEVWTRGFGGRQEAQGSGMSQDALGAAIAHGLALLRAKDYTGFLKAFVPPDELKKMTEDSTLEKEAAQIASELGGNVLAIFERIQDIRPVLNKEGTLATFTLPGEGVDGEHEFTFKRIGKDWYIED